MVNFDREFSFEMIDAATARLGLLVSRYAYSLGWADCFTYRQRNCICCREIGHAGIKTVIHGLDVIVVYDNVRNFGGGFGHFAYGGWVDSRVVNVVTIFMRWREGGGLWRKRDLLGSGWVILRCIVRNSC